MSVKCEIYRDSMQNYKKYGMCKFLGEDEECYATGASPTLSGDLLGRKPDWCPLRPMPEKIHNDNGYDEYSDGYDAGWNACIDAICDRRWENGN